MTDIDLETVPAKLFGQSLRGIGINPLSRDVLALAGFLRDVFGLGIHRLSDDFAIVAHDGMVFQVHSDAAFGPHPLFALVPATPPRAGGAQFYLFGVDPDLAAQRAEAAGGMVVEAPTEKAHGLREATILTPEGFAFSPAIPIPE